MKIDSTDHKVFDWMELEKCDCSGTSQGADFRKLFDDERLNIIPIKENSKIPLIKWRSYQEKTYPRTDVVSDEQNFAVICGKISGGLVIIDFDDPKLYYTFFSMRPTLTVRTPSGGYHMYYFSKIIPNKETHFQGWAIDVQGEKSYALMPPSVIDNVRYEIINDKDIAETEDIVQDIKKALPQPDTRGATVADIIERLKDRVNVSDHILRDVKKENTGKGFWQGFCPFHDDRTGKSPSFTVYEDHYYCFSCQKYGDVINYVMQKEKISTWEAVLQLQEDYGIPDSDLGIKPNLTRNPPPNNNRSSNGPNKNSSNDVLHKDEQTDKISQGMMVLMVLEKYKFLTMRDTHEMLYYENGIYHQYGECLVEETVDRLMDAAGQGNRCDSKFVSEVVTEVRRKTFTRRDELNSPWNYVNMKNGIYDVVENIFIEHDAAHKFTRQIPVLYDPDAKCPKILKFLNEVMEDDEDGVQLLLEIVGYTLYCQYPIPKGFIFFGEVDNGKSVMIKLIHKFLGRGNCSSMPLQDIVENGFSISELYAKQANAYADLSARELKNVGIFKSLTSGDSISADVKYKGKIEFNNYAKLIFAANRLPPVNVSDDSAAMYKRFIVINFPHRFEPHEQDIFLIDKLTTPEELSGLFNLAIKALEGVIERRTFTNAMSYDDVQDDYIRKSEPLVQFVEDYLVEDVHGTVSKDEVYEAYKLYARKNKLGVWSKTQLSRNLPTYCNCSGGIAKFDGKAKRVWEGIKMKSDGQDKDKKVNGGKNHQDVFSI